MKQPVVRNSRSRERATTLVEVLIVVAIIALVAGGIGVAAFEHWGKAKQKATLADAHTVRSAVRTWWIENDASECPNIDQLKREGALDKSGRGRDAWGEPWLIQCAEGDVSVVSAGQDRKLDTPDDIRVPNAGEEVRPM